MKGFSGGRRTHLLLLLALMLLAAACEAGPIDSDPFRDRTVKQVDLSDLLAPEALAVLGPDGLFPKTAPHHSHFDMILEEEAVNLAMAWVRSFGPYNRHQLERQRGGPIDFDRLRPAGRVTVAETPWQALPREIPMPLQKHLGAYFLVTLEEGERAAVTVAVSALATDWQVEGTRLIREGTGEPYGNEFRWVGVTPDGQWGNPRPPEDAALMVARATGARVAAPPIFVRKAPNYTPLAGYWRVELDRMVSLSGTDGQTVAASVLYLDWDGALFAAINGDGTSWRLRNPLARMHPDANLEARPGMFEDLKPVTASGGGGNQ